MALFWRRVTIEEALDAVRRELAQPPSQRSPAFAQLLRLARTEELDGGTSELVERFPEPCGVVDPRGRFLCANQRMAQLLGRSDRTLLEATRSAELSQAAEEGCAGKAAERELTLPATGAQVRATVAPLSSHRALLVLVELGESKKREAMRRDFIANASHELRTPVAAIAGAAETLLSSAKPLDDDARHFVEMISRHAERLSRLTRDLLDLSRLEAGEFRPQLGSVAVEPLCEACLELFRDKAQQKQLALGFDGPPDLRVQADKRALEQILVNLLDNAVKYTPPGGRVTLLADHAGAHVILSVIDSGQGIEERHQERIFERFYRADAGRSRDTGGTGLGLAIVKHLALAQHGEVGLESGRGGSRFWIKLPSSGSEDTTQSGRTP